MDVEVIETAHEWMWRWWKQHVNDVEVVKSAHEYGYG